MNQAWDSSRKKGVENVLKGISTMVCQRSRLMKKGKRDMEKQETGKG